MNSREEQAGYLASIAQSFDVGDFDYLAPKDMRSLNMLIADAWKAYGESGDVEHQIREIEQSIGHGKTSH